jgi:type I restriction enzyme, S subunit
MRTEVIIPETWKPKSLGNLCSLLNGFAFKPRDWSSTGTPIIRIQNLNGGMDFNYYKGPIPTDYEIEPGTLLFAWSGNRSTSFGPFIWKGPRGLLNQHIFKVFPSDGVDPDWFYFALDDVRQRVERDAHGAIGLVHVRRGELQSYLVLTPEEAEQKAIARVLQNLDDVIQQTAVGIEKLKEIKAGLLHDLLTRGIDENGQLRDPIRHPEQFKDSPLGKVPADWEVKPLDALCSHIGSGITPTGGHKVYRKDGVLFVRSQNVTFDGLLLEDVAFIDDHIHEAMRRSEIFPHDVLLNITGASIGRCCPFPDKLGPANVNQHVCSIRLTPSPSESDAVYLAAFLGSSFGKSQIERLNAGSNRQGLNYAQIRSFIIHWPKPEERERIFAVLRAIPNRIKSETAFHRKLTLIKQGLLHNLLTGRVRVPMKRHEGKL